MKTKELTPHSALKSRIRTLGMRTAALRRKMSVMKDPTKISRLGELNELEKRHKHLEERLREIDAQGPGFRQDVHAELTLLADNFEGMLDSFMFSTEAHYFADQLSLNERHS